MQLRLGLKEMFGERITLEAARALVPERYSIAFLIAVLIFECVRLRLFYVICYWPVSFFLRIRVVYVLIWD